MGILALIPIKDWLYGGAIVLLIVFGIHVHHKLLAEGIAQQKAADDKATAALIQQTAAQTAELQAKATMAEQAYDKEVNSLNNMPPVSVRLCSYPHRSNPVVPQASGTNSGDATPGASSEDVQQMPSGNSSGGAGGAGPDIGNLLSLLAQRADETSAELREFQSR